MGVPWLLSFLGLALEQRVSCERVGHVEVGNTGFLLARKSIPQFRICVCSATCFSFKRCVKGISRGQRLSFLVEWMCFFTQCAFPTSCVCVCPGLPKMLHCMKRGSFVPLPRIVQTTLMEPGSKTQQPCNCCALKSYGQGCSNNSLM